MGRGLLVVGALNLLARAFADLPPCATAYDSCIAARAGVTFADTWRSIGNGKPFTDPVHKGSVCREKTWYDLMTCQSNPVLQFELTEPAEWRGAKLLLRASVFKPWIPDAHIDPTHRLHGRELEVAVGGDFRNGFPNACSDEALSRFPNVTGKVVILQRGCSAGGHFRTLRERKQYFEERGAAAMIVIRDTLRLELQTQSLTIVGNNVLNETLIPVYSSTTAGGEQLMHRAYRGVVKGRFLVRCGSGGFDDTPRNDYFDGCGTAEWSAKDMKGCADAARPEDRICVRCPAVARFTSSNATACLFGNYLLPYRYKNNMLNQTRRDDAALIPAGAMTFLGGSLPAQGCNESDYANYSGQVVVLRRVVLGCHLYHAVYVAQLAGVKAFWHVGVPGEKTTPVLSGNSYMIDIPVHSVGVDDAAAFLEVVRGYAADGAGHTPIAEPVHLTKGQLPEYEPQEEDTVFQLPAAAVLEDMGSFDHAVAVPCIAAILILAFAICAYAVNLSRALLGTASGVRDKAGVPLGLISTGVTLAVLSIVVSVTFSLVHAAGRTSTDTAVSDGNDGVGLMYTASLQNTRTENARWLDLLSQTLGAQVRSFLDEPVLAGALLSQQFADKYEDTWRSFEDKLGLIHAHAKVSLWEVAVRLENGFVARANGMSPYQHQYYILYTNHPDRLQPGTNATIRQTNDGWASDWVLGNLTLPNGRTFPYRQLTTSFLPLMRQIGGEWYSRDNAANDLLRTTFDSAMQRPKYWHVSQVSYDVRTTNLFRLPLTVLFPVYDRHVYVGSIELSRDIDILANGLDQALRSAANSENVTAMLATEDNAILFVRTKSVSVAANVVDIRHLAYIEGMGYYTFDNVRQPELNAYMHYRPGIEVERTNAGVLSGSFDQAKYYRERSPWTVYRADLATGAVLNADLASDYFSNCTDGSCVGAAEDGRPVVTLDGRACVTLSYNMSERAWLAGQARTSALHEPYQSDWEIFNGTQVQLENGQIGFNFTPAPHAYTPGAGGLLKQPAVVHMSHTVAMWVRPAAPIDDSPEPALASPVLFTDSTITYYTRFFANGVLKVGSLRYGCATAPLAGGPPVGVWTHLTYSVSREDRTCRVYVNGTLHSEATMALDFMTRMPLEVGLTWEPYRIGPNFAGLLDDVLILNASVPERQVSRIMRDRRFSWDVDSREWAFVERRMELEGVPPLKLSLALLIPEIDIVRAVADVNRLASQNLATLSRNTDKKLMRNLTTAALVVVAISLWVMLAFMFGNALLLGPVTTFAAQLADVAEFRVERIRAHKVWVAEFALLDRAMTVVVNNMREYRQYIPPALLGGKSQGSKEGTECNVAIVFTDIRASTSLWQFNARAMTAALKEHNRIIRYRIAESGGYEVKTIGDAFMVAFPTANDGALFGMRIQQDLLEAAWPEELLEHEVAARSADGAWAGLRVRVGVNFGAAEVSEEVKGRVDYFGHTVNVASRVEGRCVPGAVCVTDAVMDAMDWKSLGPRPRQISMGQQRLKGLDQDVCLHLLVPEAMPARAAAVELAWHEQGRPARSSIGSGGSAKTTSSKRAAKRNAGGGANRVTRKRQGTWVCREFLDRTDATVARTLFQFPGVHLPSASNPVRLVQEVLSALMSAAQATSGTLHFLFGATAVLSWQQRHALEHTKNAFAYVGHLAAALPQTLSKAHTGLASGRLLAGNIGSDGQRFTTLLGPPFTLAEILCEGCVALPAFALYANLDGTAGGAALAYPPLRRLLRPVDTWSVGTAAAADLLRVYEVWPHRAVAGADTTNPLQRHSLQSAKGSDDWGDEYWAAFEARALGAFDTADPVVQAVHQMQCEGRHLRPLIPSALLGVQTIQVNGGEEAPITDAVSFTSSEIPE